MNFLDDLNASQQEAVTTTEGYVRVIAGAGSGKTRALAYRFAYLVNVLGVLPANILCVTFTNKAAQEMRQRILKLTGDNATGHISTFHGFCVTVLQEEAHAVQYPSKFLVLDNADIDAMLTLIYEERGLTLRHKTFAEARDMIEIQKLFKHPHYYEDMIALPLETLRQKYEQAQTVDEIIFYGYLYQEKKCFGLDYNDLIKFTLYIFAANAEIKLKWQKRLEYIMIDEFQDIDKLQYQLMEALCGYHRNLFIVGDPDQTIYTWRGANVRYLLEFDQQFPEVRTILMLQNYRSTPEILAVANSLISKNKNRIPKNLEAVRPSGERPVYYHAANGQDEAWQIARQIKKLRQEGASLGEMAVLYRSHFVSRGLEEVFQKEKLPYVLYSGVQFYNRAEIKDALSYLRLVAYRDDLSLARVVNRPRRNIGEQRLKLLRQYAREENCSLYTALTRLAETESFARTGAKSFLQLLERYRENYSALPVSELLTRLLDESGYEKNLRTEGSSERLDNLAELKQSIYEYETTCGEEAVLEHYLTHVALFTNTDTAASLNKVKLMTVHAAKGLEFPYVFLCSLSEGVFPAKKTADREAMEEERRLAFVALTRAQRGLYLSESEGKTLSGVFRFPSRFILDIDKPFLHYVNPPPEDLIKAARRQMENEEEVLRPAAALEFKTGDQVRHQVLGPGTILSVDERKKAYEIKFEMLPTSRIISFRVKLERR